jgi:hypothetical protein
MATDPYAGVGSAIGSSSTDFAARAIGAAEVGAGALLILLGLSIVTGIGKSGLKLGVKVAKVVR